MAQKWTYLSGNSEDDREPQVNQEIEDFLAALSSYPERVAKEPQISFEEHLFSVITMGFREQSGLRYDN
ncbi:MAG TPA: hypothetical protein VFA89_14080 [Terriglobales bacterium]|nr:hypothetical protein [Terriglobales bacterium]